MQSVPYYPIFVNLHGRRCVVVGGGVIAARKVKGLLLCGADVAVVSPAISKHLQGLVRSNKVRYYKRRFSKSDLKDAWLVCAATNDPKVNIQVSSTAQKRYIFVNVVDETNLSSFIAPAIARKSPVTIAVSTSGVSPTLAKKIKSDLSGSLLKSTARMARLLKEIRPMVKHRLLRPIDRKKYFKELVYGRVFTFVRSGKIRLAKSHALKALNMKAAKSRNKKGLSK